ncbi:alanine--glyoxylate aminotransferase family protein [Caulobacter sp. S45]|uniref:pyridoxal-phosphate-dependent aminotransferase family protein n=1 Tax=Caulobacter sp. S45 TaxID=1641861 RepID=UPI00131B1018|nr:alanine--glyoxylate aminotransferase family protein [Caulobacter sp. S45]
MRTFHPPRRVLLGPGPSEVSSRVLLAGARPTIGHLDPAFIGLMDEIKGGLTRLFRAPQHACLPLPGPGTAGMEAAIMNLLEPGQAIVVAVNGVFGRRMGEMAERAGAEVIRVEHAMGEPVDPARVEAALWARGAKALAFVHAETSTGVVSDPGPLCALAREHGALSIVDCVTSLGGIPVDAAGWGADVLYSGTQKCLSAPPGLSPFALGPRAREAVAARKTRARTWLYDFDLLMGYWSGTGGRSYHHTAPINALYSLHEALVALEEEGVEQAFARHRRVHEGFVAGVEALGLRLPVAPAARLPQLNVVEAPLGVDEARARALMLDRFGVEIGGGLGDWAGRVWRVGLMGASATPGHVRLFLEAMASALNAQGHASNVQVALDAADARFGPV